MVINRGKFDACTSSSFRGVKTDTDKTQTDRNALHILDQGFLTRDTNHQSRGYEIRRQNNGYFKLFATNLFQVLFKIRKHFLKPFLTSAFPNDFCHKKELL